MFKNICAILLLFSAYTLQAQNKFHDRSFWKANPTIEQVEETIEKGNDVSQLNRWGFDAVTYALLENVNDKTMIHLLSKEGNEVNKLTHDGRTYIFWAAYKNNVNIVNYLLEQGAKTDIIDDKGYSVMNFMAVAGVDNLELYDLFIKHGGNILDQTPKGTNALMLFLPNAKDFEKASYFIDKGLKLESRDKKGNGVVEYTAQKGNKAMFELLVEKGLEYKRPTANNDNAMLFATKPARKGYNSLDFFKYLKSKGVKPNITNNQGQTPLHNLAYNNEELESFEFFLKHKVDVNQVNDEGNTALMNACGRNSLEVIKLLASKTKNINHTNKEGHSALTYAMRNSFEVVEFLIQQGADVSVIDQDENHLGFHLFKTYNPQNEKLFVDKLELLEKQGLKVDQTTKKGKTLLHLAAEEGSQRMIEVLVGRYKIDLEAKNQNGLTALQIAVMTGQNLELAKSFIRLGADMNVKTEFDETLYDLAKENEALKGVDISILK
jgi:ankyrin repeat protein